MAVEKSSTPRICSVPGCDRPHVARGLCKPHYRKARAEGLPDAEPVRYSPVCSIDGCGMPEDKRGMCGKHYRRMQRHGDPLHLARQPTGSLVMMGTGYFQQSQNGERKLVHIAIAERAIGGPLPRGAEVHHVNGDKTDNRPSNLVVCPDRDYHMLLHARQRAQDACGNANWRKCVRCKQYDDPANMTGRNQRGGDPNVFYHKKCAAEYAARGKARRQQAALDSQTA